MDLVGSTAFKNKREAEFGKKDQHLGPPWASTFREFYSFFPLVFEKSLDGEPLPATLQPRLVKTIGDEVLLQTRIENHRDAKRIVAFLANALVHYKKEYLAETSLLLKATAWIAGFPVNNHRVRFENALEDFIGPSIDTGFRIAKAASPSKLIVSVDLALLLLTGARPLELYFEGTETLKGVLGGRP